MKKWLSIILAASVSVSAAASVFADNDDNTKDNISNEAQTEEQVSTPTDEEVIPEGDEGIEDIEDGIFKDITAPQYSWAYPYILSMAERGYVTGYEDNTYRPDNSVTRLEVLALFSRALGASSKVNTPIIQMATEKYASIINKYKLPWGTEEIAYLMYRDVLTESDLVTYLSDDLKNEPMPRYEAAIIITKAMGGESAATADTGVSLNFTDKKAIPSNALQYVGYVNDKGIMQGMEDGSFSPMTSVLRSQMAVMLSRTCDITQYTFIRAKLLEVDTAGRLVTYKDDDGINISVGYSKNAIMSVLGEPVTPKQMTIGVDAIITKSGKTVSFVDTLADIPDASVSGKYLSRSTSSSGVTSISIYNNETGEKEAYPCAEGMIVTYNNSPATLLSFQSNDAITLNLVAGEVTSVIGETRDSEIANAVIENISLEPDFTITISHALEEYDGKVLLVDTNATVRKNGSTTDFSEIYPGDTVSLTLRYGVVQSVIAQSSVRNVEGTIQAINISARPSIDVKVNGDVNTYYVTNDVEILINKASGSLYDFRVGDIVKITLEGQAVTKIVATAAQSSSGKIEGVVTSVNPSYGFIKVSYELSSGATAEETVYCKDTSTTVMTNMGSTKKVADIKEGQTVIATGTTSNGAFTAKVIVISVSE